MPRIPELRSCKHCGVSGLVWRKLAGPRGHSVRLTNPVTGAIHYCREYYNQRDRYNPIPNPVIPSPSPDDAPVVPEPVIVPEPVVIEPEPIVIAPIWDGKHMEWQTLLERCRKRLNNLLVGPAGTGKTKAAEQIHQALGLPYYPMSVGPQTSKSDLVGYTTGGDGSYVSTGLREAFEHGGVFLLDEIDAGNPGVLTILNAILANDFVLFPDKKLIQRHADFICIAAANTYGRGANRQYVGRQALDAATLDRFTGLDWDYDMRLEKHIGRDNLAWTSYVWALRAAAEKTGIKQIFGTRRIQQGITLLSIGESADKVKSSTVFFGVSDDDRRKLESNLTDGGKYAR